MLPKQRKRALVLSGGGGRGAYHVGVLKFLHEHEWYPDVVIGTSIGAVNGAALASGHSPQSLWALWKRLKGGDVQKLNFRPLSDAFLLNTSPLRETLLNDNWIDLERVNSDKAAVHLRITATEVDSGQLHVFGNSKDIYDSGLRHEPISLDHILASCSIPLIYPATNLQGRVYWDGATVYNTPLAAAIDTGAEEIIVVLMTPWDEQGRVPLPESILQAASLSLDWALLASFRTDLKMMRRVNRVVELMGENVRLRSIIRTLVQQMGDSDSAEKYADFNEDGIPDILEGTLRLLPEPIVVSPERPIPADQIIRYSEVGHEKMYALGYTDAQRAWKAAGRQVEGSA